MTIKYKAIISGVSNEKHPDCKAGLKLTYDDIYTIDTDCFYSNDDIKSYIKRDMALVLGGGYQTDTVNNINFSLTEV